MRKQFLAGLGAVAVAAVAFLALSSAPTDAQQPTTGPAPLTPADSASYKGPKQPIFFRHDIHAGQLKMQCQYCHYSVQVSSEPGIPSMQTCMGCHLAVAGKDSTNRAEIQKLKDAWNEGKPIEWIRIHNVARHVHFPHQRHIKAMGPNACATCHGNVARMPQVYQVQNVNNMGWCINCHLERNVNRDCTACHY
ncbi:MAG TPA: cytochrome c3 family protein [Gemmatimonadales bacterium]|nr:cytochrome c3 family protein [Gemmatimonadales bacterium]